MLIQLFIDCSSIKINMPVFFLEKCVRTTAKTVVVDRKNQNALARLHLASRLLPNAYKLKRCADRVCSTEHNKDEVLQGKLSTTEYSFKLLLCIYRYKIFFLKSKTSTLSTNRFSSRPVHVYSFKKVPCPHIFCEEKISFYREEGPVHHFHTVHGNPVSIKGLC